MEDNVLVEKHLTPAGLEKGGGRWKKGGRVRKEGKHLKILPPPSLPFPHPDVTKAAKGALLRARPTGLNEYRGSFTLAMFLL